MMTNWKFTVEHFFIQIIRLTVKLLFSIMMALARSIRYMESLRKDIILRRASRCGLTGIMGDKWDMRA